METADEEFFHFLTTAQVAELFGVDQSTVNRWVQMRHLTSSRFGTGRTAPRVFNAEHIEMFGDALRAIAEAKAAA